MSSTKDVVKQLLSGFAGQHNTLTIPRPFLAVCDNDHLAALLLSQCVYWSDRTRNPEGWFAKSYKEWFDELGMTERQVRRAAGALKDLGLETVLRRSTFHDGAATLHYRINLDVFAERVLTKPQNGISPNVRTGSDETAERSFTEPISEPTQNIAAALRAYGDEHIPENRPAIVSFWEQNTGLTVGPHLRDCLLSAQEDYPTGWLEDAIKEAVESNGRSWKYVESILRRWQSQGRFAPRTPAPAVTPAPAPATPATPSAPQINPFRSNPS